MKGLILYHEGLKEKRESTFNMMSEIFGEMNSDFGISFDIFIKIRFFGRFKHRKLIKELKDWLYGTYCEFVIKYTKEGWVFLGSEDFSHSPHINLGNREFLDELIVKGFKEVYESEIINQIAKK